MYASMSTVHGPVTSMIEVGQMAGEAMRGWLAELEGFRGLMILTDEPNETAHVLTFWATREDEVRSRSTRYAMRDKLAATVGMTATANRDFAVAMLELVDGD